MHQLRMSLRKHLYLHNPVKAQTLNTAVACKWSYRQQRPPHSGQETQTSLQTDALHGKQNVTGMRGYCALHWIEYSNRCDACTQHKLCYSELYLLHALIIMCICALTARNSGPKIYLFPKIFGSASLQPGWDDKRFSSELYFKQHVMESFTSVRGSRLDMFINSSL